MTDYSPSALLRSYEGLAATASNLSEGTRGRLGDHYIATLSDFLELLRKQVTEEFVEQAKSIEGETLKWLTQVPRNALAEFVSGAYRVLSGNVSEEDRHTLERVQKWAEEEMKRRGE